MKTIISKGEFAKRKSRTPQCVSKWIKVGKISAAALIGQGNAAKIWVEQAEADLLASLDPSQQLNQAAPILRQAVEAPMQQPTLPPQLPIAAIAGAERPMADAPAAGFATERERDLARRARADADRAELDAESARRKLAIDEGRYVVAEDASREWGRELARFISETETFLTSTLARDLAQAHGLDWKAISVEIREAYRKFRSGASDDARARRDTIETEESD
ncbi:hypothetical protein JQ594_15480 [Bradyrhizobium manausense]|uniref:hypothetical protein n=1 Tax=Bradyrhizobium manausense TaxID=989370 RepID=UPI001BAA95FC|nr:hypothetical protein [Bradyrhizobium manausense]MBR0687332.1 hypothetical protein [Bradyrhizobium manausense]